MQPVQRTPNNSDAEPSHGAAVLGSAVRRPGRVVAFLRYARSWCGLSLIGLSLVSGGLGLSSAVAEEPVVGFRLITNVNNATTQVSREFVSDVFLKKATRWPSGTPIQPFDLNFGAPARRQFSSNVLRRSVAAVRSYWQQRIFSGRDVPPPEIDTDDAMIRRVQANPGSIGYVSDRAPTESVKVVEVR